MRTIRDPSQKRMFDPFEGVIGTTGRRHIQEGWQALFRAVLLQLMPVDRLSKGMSDATGAPSAELYAMAGLILIRELKDWTVPEAHEAILFRSDVQYALNLEPGFDISQRTIERYIARVQGDESISEDIFVRITDTLLHELEVDVKKQRLDSTHILSDMSNIGRPKMIGLALKRFLRDLNKHDPSLLTRLPEELLKRYCKSSDGKVFGDLRTAEKRKNALQQAAEDLWQVLSAFSDEEPVSDWPVFQELELIFSQQCELREEFVEVREKTGGHVIQNTSDPDATFCGHKGPGYQVQISETIHEDGTPNFITHAIVETAAQSDSEALEPILVGLHERGFCPDECAADASYGSDENVEFANEQGVDLVAPVPGGHQLDLEEVGVDQFELNDANEVVACPAGHAPISTRFSKSGRVWARMDEEKCRTCALLAQCKGVQRDSKTKAPNGRVQFHLKSVRAMQRRRYEQTDEFRHRYRWRAGIEATNSVIKRCLGLRRLRVRGFAAVKAATLLKLAGWNIFRAVAMRGRSEKELVGAA